MSQHLLRPSLQDDRPVIGLYSPTWSLLPGFFLGPFPVILYSAINSYRLRRPLDAIIYLLAIAGAIGLMAAAITQPVPEAVQWFKEATGRRDVAYTMLRVYALLLWGVFYLMHRPQHRSSNMMATLPSAWIPCLAASVLGLALHYASATALAYAFVAGRTV